MISRPLLLPEGEAKLLFIILDIIGAANSVDSVRTNAFAIPVDTEQLIVYLFSPTITSTPILSLVPISVSISSVFPIPIISSVPASSPSALLIRKGLFVRKVKVVEIKLVTSESFAEKLVYFLLADPIGCEVAASFANTLEPFP
jgi:hypothetical protein